MDNFEDEWIFYWNQRRYKRSVRWDPNTKTRPFRSEAGAYQYPIFTAAINADLHYQNLDQHVCYQALHIIPRDDQDTEVPIALSDKREKSNE